MTDALVARTRLRRGVRLEAADDDLVLVSAGRTTTLRGPADPVRRGLAVLATPQGVPTEALAPGAGMTRLLERLGHLTETVLTAGGEEVGWEPTVRHAGYVPAPVADDDPVRLDRFALLRSRDGELVLESARAVHRFVLRGPRARRLAADLAVPRRAADVAPEVLDRALLAHWVGAGLVERADASGFPSDVDPALAQWDVHDLLMHARSRSGRFDEPLGALSPHRGSIDPLPAVAPPRPDVLAVVPLPERAGTGRAELTLGEALEQRRSVRDYDDERPVTLPELGELLHRTFRTRARFDPADGAEPAKVSRPYPSGGGLYEHELYVVVRRCEGLAPGLHRYDGLAHELQLLSPDADAVRSMLAVAAAATGHPAAPDVLLTLTARFARMSWRYRSIAYANTLRTTGAIYQSLYLVATELGLAPCALGNGDADLSARVLGLDWLRESSVGDFLLGRRRADDVVSDGPPPPGWTLLDPPGGPS